MHQVALSRRGGTSIQAEVRPAPIRASHCRYPLKVKAILLDLDGTLMPTYKSLAALQYFEEQLGLLRSGIRPSSPTAGRGTNLNPCCTVRPARDARRPTTH